MNRKMLTMILGALLVVGFFLPYLSMGPFSISGFELIKSPGKADKYVLLLSPIAGLLLLAGAANSEKYIPSRGILVILALVGVLYLIIRSLIEGKSGAGAELFKVLGLGYWLSLASAIVLAAYNPKK
ncbi:MAG: hypothetical protein JNM19_19165 [Chitinophagaceae bacterium]|nr:hypothetical protein [Chitinophagaceae bacterium]